MGFKLSIKAISLLLMVAQAAGNVFDVTKYGARGDGKTDMGQALLAAWKEACAATRPSKVVIPKGTYALGEVLIQGPCKAPVEVQVQGTVLAPADPKFFRTGSWVGFQYIDRLTLSGGGTFDGQGTLAWKRNDCSKNSHCHQLPTNLGFNFLNNSIVRGITSKDSKEFHVKIFACKNVDLQQVTITAPGDSVNTDGIHIGRSSGITITSTNIKTGDDCVSIGDGTQQVRIEKVTCGPGHGISVGSLGKYANEEDVIGITVKNCTFMETMNGVRIKTWPASPAGIASDMHFEDIIMKNAGNPIIIDQEYCPWNQCQKKVPSRVKLSKVSFKNIRGTSSTPVAVKFVCSRTVPCQNVEVSDIDLAYQRPGGHTTIQCANIKPTFSGKMNPPKCSSSSQTS